MAKETSEKVMSLVEEELKKDPNVSVDDLFAKAKGVDSSIGKLTKRQFHARYPLQIKRRKSRGAAKKKEKASKRAAKKTTARRTRKSTRKKAAPAAAASRSGDAGREAVRGVFMNFASDMASAEARKDLVKFLAGMDKYVDRALKAAGK